MEPTVTIELAVIGDAEEVSRILKASYLEMMKDAYEPSVLRCALPLMVQANSSLLNAGSYYVARNGEGIIVACGGWTTERPGTKQIDPGIGHIRHFAVHPNWARRGIGRAIYNVCEEQARRQDIETFEVFASLNALRFYQSLSFEKLQDIDVEMAPGIAFPSIWMKRTI